MNMIPEWLLTLISQFHRSHLNAPSEKLIRSKKEDTFPFASRNALSLTVLFIHVVTLNNKHQINWNQVLFLKVVFRCMSDDRLLNRTLNSQDLSSLTLFD